MDNAEINVGDSNVQWSAPNDFQFSWNPSHIPAGIIYDPLNGNQNQCETLLSLPLMMMLMMAK